MEYIAIMLGVILFVVVMDYYEEHKDRGPWRVYDGTKSGEPDNEH